LRRTNTAVLSRRSLVPGGTIMGEAITLEDVEDAKDAYEAKLGSSFFLVRLDRATQLQIDYMGATAQLGADS
jgi:hypothetical protein